MIMLATLLYPSLVRSFLEKVAKKQISMVYKKSWFTGYQAMSWDKILKHDLFVSIAEDIEENENYPWLSEQKKKEGEEEEKQSQAVEVMTKITEIFIERQSMLFS